MFVKSIHPHYTKGSTNVFLLSAQKSCKTNSVWIWIRAPKYWNSLPDCIRGLPIFKASKSSLKSHLLSFYNT